MKVRRRCGETPSRAATPSRGSDATDPLGVGADGAKLLVPLLTWTRKRSVSSPNAVYKALGTRPRPAQLLAIDPSPIPHFCTAMARSACLVATTALLVATLMHLVCAAPTGTTAVAARGSDARHPTAIGALKVALRGRRKQRRKQRPSPP